MCSTVIYVYSCRHRESTVFRCNRLPRTASQEAIEACIRREANTNGNWTTQINEFCHDCEVAHRQARRRHRHQPPTQPRARAAEPEPEPSSAAAAWTPPATVKNEDREDHEARNRLVDALVEQLIEDVETRRAHGEQYHDFRANDEPWMASIPQRRAEGVIRPLESNHLQNIGRPEGRLRGLTPTQIWRFMP